MNKLILAAITGALAILATPASVGQQHGHSHAHGSYSHSSYRHVSHHSDHSYHKPVHYAQVRTIVRVDIPVGRSAGCERSSDQAGTTAGSRRTTA